MIKHKYEISLVIPCFNEKGNAKILAKKINKAFKKQFDSYEVLWVDDGSTDNTKYELKKIIKKYPYQKAIFLMRNVGQSTALMAGLNKASGKYIATIDGDVQNDPDEIPKMLLKLKKEKLDMVVGWRKKRWRDERSRRILSLTANWILKNSFPNTKIHDAGCPVKIAKAKILKSLRIYGELHRMVTYMAGDLGARIGEIPIKHRKRIYGESKYGFKRIFKVIMDIFTLKFLVERKTTPLQMMCFPILLLFGLGSLFFIILIFLMITKNQDITDSPFLLLSLFSFLTGVQFFVLGLLGEIIIRTYFESSGKNGYVIRTILK